MSSLREFARVPFSLQGVAVLLFMAAPVPAESPSPLPEHPLRLGDCLRISEERQPSLVVARARLESAVSKLASLESLDGPVARMRHDLPIRREQARLGIDAARANLTRLQIENRYIVIRSYVSVLYARAQKKVLDAFIDDLKYIRERVSGPSEKRDQQEWSVSPVDLVTINLRRTEARHAEAERGIALALAALREAMGLDLTVCFTIADEPIPQPVVRVSHEEILEAAATRRSEVVAANLASEATVLETDAQAARCRRGAVNTYAAASDLHANHVPQPIFGEEFRPGGIPLAMPDILVGPRDGRVATAQNFTVQAAAVAQKTRNLAILEAEEAFYLWQEWSQKVVLLGEAERIASRLGGELHEQFRGSLRRLVEALLPESLLATQIRTDYNEALFRQAISLAALERVTGGAFCSGLENVPPPTQP